MNNVCGSYISDVDVTVLTLMTKSVCAQPGAALWMACLRLCLLFQADNK